MGVFLSNKLVKVIFFVVLPLLLIGLVVFLVLGTNLRGNKNAFNSIDSLDLGKNNREINQLEIINQHAVFEAKLNDGVEVSAITDHFKLDNGQKIRVIFTDQPQPLKEYVIKNNQKLMVSSYNASSDFGQDKAMILTVNMDAGSLALLGDGPEALSIIFEKVFFQAISDAVNKRNDVIQKGALVQPEERFDKSFRDAEIAREYLNALNKGRLFFVEKK